MIDIKYNRTMPRDYVKLMLKSGAKPCKAETAIGAIKNSVFTVGIYNGEELIAFGRICGDGFRFLVICDIMVDARYAGKKLELAIIKELDAFVKETVKPDTTVLAQVDAPLGRILTHLGYKYYDEDYSVVMKRP